MLRVSLQSKIVTPHYPVTLAGGATRKGKAIGVYSDVKVMTLALEINGEKILFASVDATGLTVEDNEVVRERMSKAAGVPVTHVYIAATHTHSAPSLRSASNNPDEIDENYRTVVFDSLVECTEAAVNNLMEASASFRQGEVFGYYGNRDRKDKDGDQSVTLIEFKDSSNKVIAALVNIHCHPTFLDQSRQLISADLAGSLRKALAAHIGIEPIFICGVTGDMSSRYWRKDQSYFELENSARGIAEKVMSFETSGKLELDEISIKEVEYLIHREIDLNEWKIKLEKYLEQEKTETDPIEARLLQTKIRGARNMVNSKETLIHLVLKTAIITLGDLQVVTFNNDPVVYFGKQIKAASKAKLCITMNHVNGEVGYLVQREDFNTGYIGNVTKALPGQAEEYIEKIIEAL